MPTTRKRSLSTRESLLQKAPDDKSYASFLKTLQLFGTGLKSCSSEVQRWPLLAALEKKREPTRKFVESYDLTDCVANFFDCQGHFTYTITDNDVKNPVLLRVECVYEAHIHGAGVNPDLAQRFVTSELRLMLRPYARALISDITARMAVPPVTLPLAVS